MIKQRKASTYLHNNKKATRKFGEAGLEKGRLLKGGLRSLWGEGARRSPLSYRNQGFSLLFSLSLACGLENKKSKMRPYKHQEGLDSTPQTLRTWLNLIPSRALFAFLSKKNCKSPVSLSREGVVSSCSVVATPLVSRLGVEFGTLRACRYCRLEAVGSVILGAPKCLQIGRALLRKHFEGPRGLASCFGSTASCSGAI